MTMNNEEPSVSAIRFHLDGDHCDQDQALAASHNEPHPVHTSLNQSPPPKQATSAGLRVYYTVSFIYLAYTVTDTALRVVILLHASSLHFSAFQIALMFTLYELAGVGTNFIGGIVGSIIGLKRLLLVGLICQMLSCILLCPFTTPSSFDVFRYQYGKVAFVMFTQAFSGVAKDLIKLSGKSVPKLVTNADEQGNTLLKLVTNITGAKNAIKGLGFFFGTFFLQLTGFLTTLLVLIGLLALLIPFLLYNVDSQLGRAAQRKKINWSKVFNKGFDFNLFCLARMTLFASRDVWFEVVLPIYFTTQLGWSSLEIGSFMAGWVILYGGVQSNANRLAFKPLHCSPPQLQHLWTWTCVLAAVAMLVAAVMTGVYSAHSVSAITAVLIVGLLLNAYAFAINSSVHSYLVVLLSDHDKVAQDVGFYYMSNAVGRLIGTLLSGVLYSYYATSSDVPDLGLSEKDARTQSFTACLWASAIFAVLSTLLAYIITYHRKQLPSPGADAGEMSMLTHVTSTVTASA